LLGVLRGDHQKNHRPAPLNRKRPPTDQARGAESADLRRAFMLVCNPVLWRQPGFGLAFGASIAREPSEMTNRLRLG
jgi:hypothetical protein